jgi:hypothetical protein
LAGVLGGEAVPPAEQVALIAGQATTQLRPVVSCPTLRSACRNADHRPTVRPLPLQRVLAALQEVVPPGRQRRCASTPSSRDSTSNGSPRNSRSTASIFLPADHLGRDR